MQVNDSIYAREVRLIGPQGEALGIMATSKAQAMAYDQGLDLVMVSDQGDVPVCKIMDYGKYRFDREKREKEARKKQQTIELKEIQLSYRIEDHDMETKLKHARRFLTEGNRVRVVMRFRGREMSHLQMGREVLERFKEACSDLGAVDKQPLLDGKLLSVIIRPLNTKPLK
ncbi:MAG: translation initiation factor IF-3 [Clostridia bacterium]|nr:translation initiation factor IF-3 [Clostridia bacterium]